MATSALPAISDCTDERRRADSQVLSRFGRLGLMAAIPDKVGTDEATWLVLAIAMLGALI